MRQLLIAIACIVGGLLLLTQVGCNKLQAELMPPEAQQIATRYETVKIASGRLDKAAWRWVKPGYAKTFHMNYTILLLSPDMHRKLAPPECKQQCIKCWGEDCIAYLIGGEFPTGKIYFPQFAAGHEAYHYADFRYNLNSNPDGLGW